MLLYMRFEAGWLKVDRVKFTLSNKGLKIIQLSDIHMKYLKVSAQKVKNVISREKPDIIIMTGDYIENQDQIDAFLHFLETIRTIKSDTVIYLCMGNHDYKAFDRNCGKYHRQFHCKPHGHSKYQSHNIEDFIQSIESLGVTVLYNRAVSYSKNSVKYNIIGFDDVNAGHPDINKALSFCAEDAFVNIAFSHNPDIIFQIPKGKVDYLFCGHFHGGQIWMPFHLEFNLLRKEKLCRIGINRGLHKLNGINLYINRGLGNVCFPLRFLSRPEITVFYLP